MKNFSFQIFNYKTKFRKKIRHDVIIEMEIGLVKRFALGNQETIVNKR